MGELLIEQGSALEAASGTGTYEWCPMDDQILCSAGLLHIYGLTESPRNEAGFSRFVHPADRGRVDAEIAAYLSGNAGTYSHRFRIVRPDGTVRHILNRGIIERDNGRQVRMVRGINVDLTDLDASQALREQADPELLDRLKQVETLYAEAPIGLGVLDREFRFTQINRTLAEINGFPVEDHFGKRAWDLVPDLRESAEPALRHVLETGEPLRDVIVKGQTAAHPGIAREWREHFYPLRDQDGAIQGIGIICEEVTVRVAAERALTESEARFRAMADSAPVMIWVTEPDGSCTYLNRNWYEFTGQSQQDALGFGWLRAVHPDDAAESVRIFLDATAQHKAFRLDYRLRRADGVFRWVIDSARPRFGADGGFLGFIGSVIDITERKNAELSLLAAHETFRQLVDRSPFGIYAIDADFRLVQVSNGAQEVFKNVHPLIGRDFAEVLRIIWPEPFADEVIGIFRHTLITGDSYHAPGTVEQRADVNATQAYDWKIERITMPDGRYGVVCHFYDLSERQAYEEKIEYLMREVNHRAKNMLALVDAVAKQTAAVGREDFLERFSERVQALAAGQDLLVQSAWEKADLAALIESQLLHFKDLVGRRILLDGPTIDLSPAASQTLGMAFHEMATNAAKYGALSNQAGRVEVEWRIDDSTEGDVFCISWTEKNGPPVEQPTRRGFGGRVAKTAVERTLSGQVSFEFPKEGVVWTLRCPLASIAAGRDRPTAVSAPNILPREAGSAAAVNVLLVEDDSLLALHITQALRQHGCAIIGPASSVEQAKELLERDTPDLAVLDINLGKETAESVARWLRDHEIPFVGLSSYTQTQAPPIFRDAPYLSKPVEMKRLLEQIDAILRKPPVCSPEIEGRVDPAEELAPRTS